MISLANYQRTIMHKPHYNIPPERTENRVSLCSELVYRGHITPALADRAAAIAQQRTVSLADVFVRGFGVSQYAIAQAQATERGTQYINPITDAPDTALIDRFGPAKCLQMGLIPWRKIGGETIVLTTRPENFYQDQAILRTHFGSVRMAVTTEDHLNRALSQLYKDTLVTRAENRTPDHESCRNWVPGRAMTVGAIAGACTIASAIVAPMLLIAALTAWAAITLFLTTALKMAAAVIGWRDAARPTNNVVPVRLPTITMLVPLYNETAIADHLLARLSALDYPRELLDICLVLEADDQTTRATLGRTTLPCGIRAIIVPTGGIKTKPRALNYALDFARGDIIGVWDAEDAPAADQLHKVAISFANAPPDVACLQGKLDYYNASANWLTRCFTIEYASWFRVILPGLQRLGLALPLGGTTLFFQRDVLHKLGGWDAHNVTEDADLGIRLARHGYRTHLIDTVTEEEANGRAWPWVKQRSRWLKGYAITYGVHMRDPARLWRDLGPWRFFGVQLLFLGTLSQFVLAPLLWTFWLPALGFAHPLSPILPTWAFWALAGLFFLSEAVGWLVAYVALKKAEKRWLFKWAFSLTLYFPLGALAAYKGIFELLTKPFYWDKTAHGVLLPNSWQATNPPPQPLLRPVSDG
jgi:cellulose synthase/poly-beta-1,6-N-acetylglucosamine synthase-like glycosyltransferase